MDAYIEERFAEDAEYADQPTTRHYNAKGYQTACALRRACGLDDVVDFKVGWSPDDVARILAGRTVDCVFIDARHDDAGVVADVAAVRPFMAPSCTVLLHDVHRFSWSVLDKVMALLGGVATIPALRRTSGLMVVEGVA